MNITTFKTLVLREYWENKSFVRAPLIIASVLLISLLVGMMLGQYAIDSTGVMKEFHLVDNLKIVHESEEHRIDHAMTAMQFGIFLVPMSIGLFILLFFYSLGSLYNEKRDRSILFWKSMPVSDTQTVLSKVFSALVIAPLITAAFVVIAQFVFLLMLTPMVWINGGSAWNLVWSQSSLFYVWAIDFSFALLLALWMLPILGWLWLVSAWANRGAFLIAVFIPLGIMLVELLILQSTHFANLLGTHFEGMAILGDGMLESGNPLVLLGEPRFWIGCLVGAGFIGGAIYQRRYKDDSY